MRCPGLADMVFSHLTGRSLCHFDLRTKIQSKKVMPADFTYIAVGIILADVVIISILSAIIYRK